MTLPRFAADGSGNVTIVAAACLAGLIGFLAIAVDLGQFFYLKRRQQSAADLAAMAAAADLPNAARATAASIASNAYRTRDVEAIEFGLYRADPAVPLANRFTPTGAASANAVRVVVATRNPLIFGGALARLTGAGSTADDTVLIRTRAVAASSQFASFAIGTRLASLDAGLLNAVLGGLTGSRVALTAMDYRALADTRVDLFAYSRALETRLGLTAVSYHDLVDRDIDASDAVMALAEALGGSSGTAARAVRSLSGAQGRLRLSSLLDIGPYAHLDLAAMPTTVRASVSALDMLDAVARLAAGGHQIEVSLAPSIPGILAAELRLAVGEPPVGSARFAVGARGASVHTAQTRLLLTVTVPGSGLVPNLTIPIYIELAPGTAVLTDASCGRAGDVSMAATLAVSPGIAEGFIGDVSIRDFVNFSVRPSPEPAALVSSPLLRVSGLAHAAVANRAPTTVSFAHADIAAGLGKTVGTGDVVTSLASTLIGDLQLRFGLGPVNLAVPQSTMLLTREVLMAAGQPIDRLLVATLATLGIGVGQSTVWVDGVRCDGSALVE